MKKTLLVLAFILCASVAAKAESAPAAPVKQEKKAAAADKKTAEPSPAEKQQRFTAHRAQVIKQMNDRITEMQARTEELQKRLNCMESAVTPETMRACYPKVPDRGGWIEDDASSGWEERRKEWQEFHEGWKRKHGMTGGKTMPAAGVEGNAP